MSRASRNVKRNVRGGVGVYPIAQDPDVGEHRFDWFADVVAGSESALRGDGYEPYKYTVKKCGDAFCNKADGHQYGPNAVPCSNEMFPVKDWEHEQTGWRRPERIRGNRTHDGSQ